MTMRLFVCAAEASGDRWGADVVRHLRQRFPSLQAEGLAGPSMRAAGVLAHARAEEIQVIGVTDALRRAPALLKLRQRLWRAFVNAKPQVLLTIDAPDWMLPFAKRAKQRGGFVAHWVCPQVWAWRPWRARWVFRGVDRVYCLLPFEPAYDATGSTALFCGHPGAATVPFGPGMREHVVLLCPGSRPSEVARHWPVLRTAAQHMARVDPRLRFATLCAPTIDRAELSGLATLFVDDVAKVHGACVALAASGTVTLQLAALDVPVVVLYQTDAVTWAVGRRLVRGVRHLALCNIVAGRELQPEVLQHIEPTQLAEAALAVRGVSHQVPRDVLAAFDGKRAVERVADDIAAHLRVLRP